MKTTDARHDRQQRSARRLGLVEPAGPGHAAEPARRRESARAPESRGPLVVTSDVEVLDHVLAASAAAGVEPRVIDEATAARSAWRAEQMVIVGSDRARQLASLALPRRAEVFLVGLEADRGELDRWSAPLGAAVVLLPERSAWLTTAISDVTGRSARAGVVVSVVGGCGGVGASTFTAALAVGAASRGISAMLIDLDPLGGGIDLVMGVENRPGWRWNRLTGAQGHLADLSEHLPRVADVSVLASDRGPAPEVALSGDAVRSVLTSAARHHRLVAVDLPRAPSAASLEALRCSDRAVLLAGADVRGVTAGRQAAGWLADSSTPLSVVVRTVRGGIEPRLVAEALGADLLGVLGDDQALRRAGDSGEPPGRSPRSALARAGETVLESLGLVNRRAA